MKTLGLGVICKDEFTDIKRIIDDYNQYFDQIVITVTSKNRWKEIYALGNEKVTINYFEWCDDFAAARNFNFSHLKTDWIFWCDSDDKIDNPEKLSEIIKDAPVDLDLVWLYYYYDMVEGVEHWRERLLKNNDTFYWKGVVHENLLAKENLNFRISYSDLATLTHQPTEERQETSATRNLALLIKEYEKHGEDTDPRILSYIGMTLYGMGGYEDCVGFFQHHIEKSGWKEDVYNSCIMLARAFQYLNNLEASISYCYKAIEIRHDFPDAYYVLAELKFYQEDWAACEAWTQTASSKKIPKFGLPIMRRANYTYRPMVFLANAYLQMGSFEKASTCIQLALKASNNMPSVGRQVEFINDIYAEKKVFENFVAIHAYLTKHDKDKIKVLGNLIPKNLAKDDKFIKIRNAVSEPQTWVKDSIAIYCGEGGEDWADPSVIMGIGGSEEAVIYASREFVKQGRHVTVYCSCGDLEGNYNGVTYKNWYEFNMKDAFDTLICWRGSFFERELKARKKIVWLHDVPAVNEFNSKELKAIDHILVLSDYHKTLLSKEAQEIAYVTTNGINVCDFKDGIEKESHRMCYTSSMDRGVEHLLDMWGDIRKAVPDATLHLYYGWETFDMRYLDDKSMHEWKAKIQSKMEQEGITFHGRIGHKKIAKEMARCEVFAYPADFEEINCISVLKAQLAGALPVTTDYCALSQTNEYGIKTKPKDWDGYKAALIDALKTNKKLTDTQMKAIRDKYSWEAITKDWSENIL